MPLFALSPERQNARAQTPTKFDFGRGSLNADISPSKLFGHPEYGIPGDFGSKTIDLTDDFAQNEYSFKSPFAKSDSTFKVPALPGSPTRHERAQSDVHSMVARFDSLKIQDPEELKKKHAAALKRAQMGREEAEADARQLKEEIKEMKSEMDDYRARETRVMKRLDTMTDDLHRAKETQAHAQTLYEKEIRKARKEAFRASSSVVKLQEELKSARSTLRTLSSDLEAERGKATRREQEAFTAQYQLIGVQEDLADVKAKAKVTEEERDALKTSLKEEEVARIAAEGRIALPVVEDTDDEFASPWKKRRSSGRKSMTSPRTSLSGHQDSISEEMEQLQQELDIQMRRREAAEDMLYYMKMECQFGCCSCRIAEQEKRRYVHDGSFEEEVMQIKQAMKGMLTPPDSVDGRDTVHEKHDAPQEEQFELIDLTMTMASPQRFMPPQTQRNTSDGEGMTGELSPTSRRPAGPMSHFALPTASSIAHAAPDVDEEEEATAAPETPQHSHPFRTTTTTIIIPLADHSSMPTTFVQDPVSSTPATTNLSSSQTSTQAQTESQAQTASQAQNAHPDFSAFHTPSGLTREAAIEQLRLRRGRAKSVVAPTASNLAVANAASAGMTPMTTSKKGRLFDTGSTPGEVRGETETPRREFSAPEMGTGKRMAGMRSVSRPGSRVASK
jgi:hypothetical protein